MIGCYGCVMKNKCQRCIPQNFLWFNDVTAPPPVCIENGKNLGLTDLLNYKKLLNEKLNENQN